MSTSLNTAYESTGNRIIQDAYEHLRVKQKGQNISADDQAKARRYLNSIIKSWQADGIHLWKDVEAAVFLESSRRVYPLGNQSNFRFAAADTPVENNPVYATQGDWVATTLTADALAAQADIAITSLTAYSGTTFNTGSTAIRVGVELNSGSIQWSTLSSIATLTITLADNLTGAASSGNQVFLCYTNYDLNKPLTIYKDNVRLWQTGDTEIPLYLLSYTDYNLLPEKLSTGTPVQIAYQPKIDTGDLAVWPVASSVGDVLLFRCQAEIDIFSNSYTQDFPPEWIRALGWALASELGSSIGVPLQRQGYIDSRASALKEQVLDADQDNSSLFIYPRMW